MPIDFSKFQKKIPDSQEKITPGENIQKVAKQNKKSSKRSTPTPSISVQDSFDTSKKIDHKINELLNERLLKLVKSGLKHELTRDNLLKYIKTHKGTKTYKLADFFDANINKIEKIVKDFHSKGIIRKDKNNFYII